MEIGQIWQELGDGIYRRRYEFLDQNIGAVIAAEAVLILDTRANPQQGEEILADLALLTPLPVGWVFNTHYHWDHTFGNQAFPQAELWGHQLCAEGLLKQGERMLEEVLAGLPAQDHAPYREVVFTPPTELFDVAAQIDLGNRTVDLEFLGSGHTNSDAILHVDGVTFAGDLIEEGGPPSFGDSFPIAWIDTLARLEGLSRPTVVPGHGDVVGRDFVRGTREQLLWLADTARVASAHGLAVNEIDLTGAPFPDDTCREALQRAYDELSSSRKFSQ
ncbi:MAG TPA: MBL fold metallo-hydrolase [Acidimicrobiia bacterium]|nr:MBL fold metallo-hydrolase [Acidimicrobiia bacterium]